MTFGPFTDFIDAGEPFVYCRACKRVGRRNWAHKCGTNWYRSVAELRESDRQAEARIRANPMVVATHAPRRRR